MEEELIKTEEINEDKNIINQSIKKIKKKVKKNYKNLKDLLDNIKESKEKTANNKKIKKKKNKNKEIIKENAKDEINNDDENNNKNNSKSEILKLHSSTASSSISQEENNIDIQKDNFESQTKKENNKFKLMNYIPKNIGNNNILNNIDDENSAKVSSPMYEYFKEMEKNLKNMKSVVDLNNSINFVKKDVISSSKFNFYNNRFIIKNNIGCIYGEFNKNHCVNDNSYNYKYNYIFNIGYNNKYNNVFYYNNYNINFFHNNIYLNNSDVKKNMENKFDDINQNKFDKNENSNFSFNINNYNLQNKFSFKEKKAQKQSEEKLCDKISENLNNNNNNYQNKYPLSLNVNTDSNNTYSRNNILNNDNKNNNNYNNNEFYQKINNNKNAQIDKNAPNNEPIKKNKFCPRPNDWVCSKCFNINFAFRVFCNRCKESRDFSLSNNNF